MSDNEEHIPPTSDIRETYASAWTGCHNQLGQDYFDRWHAAEIRRAKAEALRAARIELGTLAHCINVTPWELLDTLDARIKRFEARDD